MTNKLAVLRSSLGSASKIDQGMLRFVLDQSLDCIKILSPEGRVEYVNSEGQCALQISDFSKINGKFWPDLWPEESRLSVEEALNAALDGQGTTFDAWRPDNAGERRWWQISVSPLQDGPGDLAGILTISRDVTEHVRLRETERTLSLEMKHRLRNAYTVASAIVTQSARGKTAEQRDFAETVSSRLADVALSQTRLLEAGQKSWTLSQLVETLVEAHGEGATGVRYAGPADVAINGQAAMLTALVIGELTNNSLKHGALRHGRTISLSWSHAAELVIRWREPLPKPLGNDLSARDAGSGYSLMSRMAQSQRASFKFEADGSELRATLRLRSF